MDEFPRRNRSDQWVPAEKAIHAAVVEVERLGCNLNLTRAVILLLQAKDLVADFVEHAPTEAP